MQPTVKPKEGERDVQVIPGRMGNGVCVQVCAVCPKAGDQMAVSSSPTAKAEVRGEERKEKARVSSHVAQRHGVTRM